MPLSVLFDARLAVGTPTGIGQYIASLIPAMLDAAPDVEIHLLRGRSPWPGYGIAAWQSPNLTHHISDRHPMALRAHAEIPSLATSLGVALAHCPHFNAPVLGAQTPVVATIHDAKYLVRPDLFTRLGWLKRQAMRRIFARTLRCARAVITDSESTSRDLVRLFNTPMDRLHRIHLAADPQFKPAPPAAIEETRQRHGLTRPYVLTVGERRPHKNHVGLIRAYHATGVRQTHDLVIVGQPHQSHTEPEREAERLGLLGRIHFLSDVPMHDLIALHTAADLFVLVSLYEGFGLPLLEAMACGTPVIASNTTSTGEVAGEGAHLVDPENTEAISRAVDTILSSEDRRRDLISRGEDWVRRFSWEETARRTVDVYRTVARR